MATFIGKDGVVRVGANAIAEIVDYEIEETAELVEDTALGDEQRTYKSGADILKGWTIRMTTHWDDTDTNGQGAALIGAEIAIEAYPEGTTASNAKYSGNAVVDSVQVAAGPSSVVARTITATGNGALTIGTA